MLRALFILLSVLTDHSAVADLVHADFRVAVSATGLLLGLGLVQLVRHLVQSRSRLAG